MENKNKNLSLFILMIITMLYISSTLSFQLDGATKDMKDMYIYYYSYIFLTEDFSTLKVVISSLSTVFIVSIFADSIWSELEKNAVYIFTRTRKTKKWITNKLINILVNLIKIQVIQFGISFIYFSFLGYKISNVKEFMLLMLILFTLVVSTQYILVIIANIVSIKINQVSGYIVSNSLIIISQIMFYGFYFKSTVLMKFLPFTQYMIVIQDNKLIDRNVKYFIHFIKGYSTFQALSYNIIFIIVLFLIGRKCIEKHEFY